MIRALMTTVYFLAGLLGVWAIGLTIWGPR